ncbi:teichuronic acid biosynthesis protein TuaB [Bacteroidia bacterium]|nr:teichuronic acid biosynthesis protein TuaB [Bacteroidia bacterium]
MSLKEKAISGAKWTTVSTIITAIVQMLRLMILTRFLDKEEFGIVAIITFVLGLTYTFSDIGFSAAIMHKKDIEVKEFSSLFWIQFLIFFVIYIILSCLSPLVASFYNEKAITYLMPVALIDLVLSGFGKLYDTVLQKRMLFRVIALRNIISAFCSVIVAFVLAYMGFGIYSMIISALSQTVINNFWNFICGQREYKIQLFCSVNKVKPYFKIGIFQTGTQIIDYFCAKLDILIIGKFLGSEMLGVYSLAKEIVLKLVLVINSIVNKVALPVLSHNNTNNDILRTQYCKMLNLLSLINFPINVFFCVFSTQIVVLFYGQKYSDVVPLVSIFALYGILLSIGNLIGNIAIAKGRTDISFRYVIIRCIVSTIIITITTLYSIQFVAWGQVLLALIMFFIGWKMLLKKLIQLSIFRYLKPFRSIGFISLIMVISFFVIIHCNIFDITGPFYQLIIYGIIFVLTYTLLVYFFMRDEVFILIKEFSNNKNGSIQQKKYSMTK